MNACVVPSGTLIENSLLFCDCGRVMTVVVVAEYAVALCDATRHPATYNLPDLAGYIAYGASPRGSINLVAAARALAVLRGRSYALPQDVQELARDVLRHRLVLTYQALAEQVTPDTLLTAVLNAIPPPRIDLAREQPA